MGRGEGMKYKCTNDEASSPHLHQGSKVHIHQMPPREMSQTLKKNTCNLTGRGENNKFMPKFSGRKWGKMLRLCGEHTRLCGNFNSKQNVRTIVKREALGLQSLIQSLSFLKE